jgi:SPP1 family predicted phage head-tail adaptor
MIAPQAATIGDRPHRVTFQNPGPPVPDGDGGYLQSWTDLRPPALWMKITAASAAALERVAAGTVIATATHLLTGPYHPQVTTQTRCLFDGRSFQVGNVTNREERDQEMVLVCTEQIS